MVDGTTSARWWLFDLLSHLQVRLLTKIVDKSKRSNGSSSAPGS